MIFAFNGDAEAMAAVIESGRNEVEALCRELFDNVQGFDVEIAERQSTLEKVVAEDEKIMLIQRIIGGDIVGVQPDDAV